jgi:hypothetical protein
LATLTLFESEYARKAKNAKARPIARRLDEQHRMHPAVAGIASKCFYDGKLITNPEKEKEYREGTAPLHSADPARLPNKPITFVDLRWVRSEHGYRGGDRSPPWSNPDEVRAALGPLCARPAEVRTVGYASERSRRLFDEMVPPPTRKIACRLTYAGFR